MLGWGIPIQSTCLLCGKEVETISQLFFNYNYTKHLLLKLTEFLNQAIWKISNFPSSTLTNPDIRIGDRYNCDLPRTDSLANSMGPSLEYNQKPHLAHLDPESNRRLRQHTLRSPEILFLEIIKDSNLSFKAEIFKDYSSQMEMTNMHVCETNFLRISS